MQRQINGFKLILLPIPEQRQNHRVGRSLKDHRVPICLPWTSPTRSGCSKARPNWLRTLPGTGRDSFSPTDGNSCWIQRQDTVPSPLECQTRAHAGEAEAPKPPAGFDTGASLCGSVEGNQALWNPAAAEHH